MLNEITECDKQNDIRLHILVDQPDPELLEALKDLETEVDVGPPITPQLAECIDKTVKRPLKKETLTKLTSDLKIPENCRGLSVPKMNPEIWSNLPTKAKVNDLGLQNLQQYTSYGLIALANMGDVITKNGDGISKDVARQLIEITRNAANVLGNGYQIITQKRRQEVKTYLNAEFSGICSSSIQATEFLFGDDLKETLKSSRAAASVVRQSFTKRGGYRFKPYTTTASNFNGIRKSLNWNRPSQQAPQTRGGWRSQYPKANQSQFQYQKRGFPPRHQ